MVVLASDFQPVPVRGDGTQHRSSRPGVDALTTNRDHLAQGIPLVRQLVQQQSSSGVGLPFHFDGYRTLWLIERKFLFFPCEGNFLGLSFSWAVVLRNFRDSPGNHIAGGRRCNSSTHGFGPLEAMLPHILARSINTTVQGNSTLEGY